MRLTINGEEVTYSLEQERTLGEVVHGVRAWLATAGFVITGLSADGRSLLEAPADAWGTTSVEKVAVLEVLTTHTGDMRVAHWRTVETWLAMLGTEISAGADHGTEAGALDELLADLPQTVEGFTANPFLPPGSDAAGRFLAVFSGATASTVRSWPEEKRREAADLVQHLLGLVRARLEDATHPAEALARCAGRLKSSLGELKEVSVLLQTGRDRSAMEAVIRFADLAQSIMDLMPFLPPHPERARLFTELTPTLKELVGAFDSRDSVLIGDLLEYEIAPRLEKLAPLLGSAT